MAEIANLRHIHLWANPMRSRSALLVLTCLSLAACSGVPTTGCRQPLIQDVLYFGLSKPSGGQITPEQWQGFLREEVTPRFPAGLSVVDAAGQWRGNDGTIVQENSKVLTLVHADDKASETAVQAIMQVYKHRFEQEAVMRLRQRSCASF